jgi:hypothetical protein
MRALLLSIVIIAAASTSYAASPVFAFVHGNDLYPGCQKTPDNGCFAYLSGVADALEMVAPRLTNICRPKGVTIDQMMDVLIDWLEDHPAERHRPAAKLAGLAFAEAWPCNR